MAAGWSRLRTTALLPPSSKPYPSPQPLFMLVMSPNHQCIPIPLSNHLSSNEAAVVGECPNPTFVTILVTCECLGASSDSQGQIPPTHNRNLSQAETNFNDGSDTLFSMYNEKKLEFDSKFIQNWREDANSVMLLVGHRPFIGSLRFD